MRVAAGALLGLRDGDVAHAFDGPAAGIGFRDALVSEHGFGDLVADAHDGIEGGHGLLKNHGDAGAAKLTELVGGQSGQVGGRSIAIAVLKSNFAGDLGGWGQEAHDG